jgi:acetyltransferase
LTEYESKQLLTAYGLPTVPTRIAADEEGAVRCADAIGYPVVVKLHSETLTHKTDVGGVRLNLSDAAAVRGAFREIGAAVRSRAGAEHFLGVTVQPMVRLEGYELILGSSVDAQFGPVLLFGLGGQLVEVFKDRALALPPLNSTLARRLMEQTRIYQALQGVRGRDPVDLAALEQILVRFSELVVAERRIKEIDINPLLAAPKQMIALDARVVLHAADLADDRLPPLAIRPYPTQYVGAWTSRSGMPLTIRPIRPEDEPLMVRFHETLSEQSVYLRYLQALHLSQRTAHERLARLCFVDYDREIPLVADRRDPETGRHEIIGVVRLIKLRGTGVAEFALLVSDQHQRQGLGAELLRRVLEVARKESVRRVVADIHLMNRPMQVICQRLGFRLYASADEGVMKAEIDL